VLSGLVSPVARRGPGGRGLGRVSEPPANWGEAYSDPPSLHSAVVPFRWQLAPPAAAPGRPVRSRSRPQARPPDAAGGPVTTQQRAGQTLDFDAARPSTSSLGKSRWWGRSRSIVVVIVVIVDAVCGGHLRGDSGDVERRPGLHHRSDGGDGRRRLLGVVARRRRLAWVEWHSSSLAGLSPSWRLWRG